MSNLGFLLKVLEKIVAAEQDAYLTNNELYANMQSAYRKLITVLNIT